MSQPAPLPEVEVQTPALQATSVTPKTAAFGVYLNGRIPVGAYHVEVSTAPKQGIDVQSHWTMRLGPSWIQRSATTRLDSALRMRTQKHRKVQVKDGGEYVDHHAAVRKGSGRWRIRDKDASGPHVQEIKTTSDLHSSSLESMVVLVPALAMQGTGRYQFTEIFSDAGVAPSQGRLETFTVAVHDTSSYTHRGIRRSVRVVRLHRAAGAPTTCIVDSSGDLLAFWIEDAPVRFISGTADEVSRQLPVAEGVVDAADPRMAIRTVLEVMTGAQPAERLDDVVDWRSVILKLGKIATADTVKAFQREVKVRFISTPAPFRLEEIPRLVGMMDVFVDSGVAQVRMSTDVEPFLLEQRDGQWWIVGLPDS